jgi:uncharacterized protein YjbJ (UPF0337 family)
LNDRRVAARAARSVFTIPDNSLLVFVSWPRAPHEARPQAINQCHLTEIRNDDRTMGAFPRKCVMNWHQIAGDWKQFTGKLKERWDKPAHRDFTTIADKRVQLACLSQQEYGYLGELMDRDGAAR